jgi:hypothetical protein
MRVCYYGKDGGPDSKVWGFWLIEIKRWFSIVLLRFESGSREAYHSHAFNAVSWLVHGMLLEKLYDGHEEAYTPSWLPIVTRRCTFHQVHSVGRSWVLSFRGPWARTWREYGPDGDVVLTNGRKVVDAWKAAA